MTISELSVRRPVLMTMVYVLICVIAMVFLPKLDIALYPSVDMPILSVMVTCDDAGPEEIEQQVAKVLENALSSVENLETITSRSQDESCMIMMEFAYGSDLDEAKDDISDIITRTTRQLPDWAETPQVISMDISSDSRIMTLVLSGDRTQAELQQIAEDTVAPLIERISGVSEVSASGGPTVEYDVNVSANRLEAYGITLSQVSSAIASRNIQSTGGTITQEGMNYQIATDERYTSLDQIRETVIATIGGVPVMVQDIAEVVEYEEISGRASFRNGEPVVTLTVTNTSDSNATTVAKAVTARLDSINSQLPDGIVLSIQQDSTEMISSSMNEVYKSAVEGVLLAAAIIFLFLRGFKSTLIISLSMPVCILITLMVMSVFGVSINSMSMSGLILGIGMIVDASIIILENTYTYRSLGEKPAIAAILGSKNMFNAIVASTLTTLCVFVPILVYKYDLGMIGMMFQDLVLTVCISLGSSLFVAVTLVPALAGSILKINTRTQKPLRFAPIRWIDNAMASLEEKMRNAYAKALAYFLHRRFLLILLLVLLLAFSFMQFSGIGISLTPSMGTDDSVTLSLTLEPGTDDEITRKYLFDMQQKIMDALPEGSWTSIMVEVGSGGMFGSSSGNEGSIEVSLPDITEQTTSASEVQNLLRPLTQLDPSATWTFSAGRGPGSSSAIDVEIHSEDSTAAKQVADQVVSILTTYVPQTTNIESDLNNGAPKISIAVDHKLAQDLGVDMKSLATTIQAAISGLTATEITTFSSDTTYDVIVQLDETDLSSIEELSALLVPATNGTVRLDSFAELATGTSPLTITRENKVRINHVTASLLDGYAASDVQTLVDAALDQHLVLPDGVTISQGGEMSQFADYGATLVIIVVLALFMVYAVMAAQFESLVDPLIIFATIPLLLIGVIWIHLTTGQDFTLFSIVGIVALIGVVVNNGIVLVDCINRLVKEKVPVKQACLQAARSRLRPILMTTLTTVLGMVPLAFFPGEGSEMMQPIALTFTGGLITGAFLTLLLSPVLYSLFNSHREKHYDDPNSLNNQLREYDLRRLTKLDSSDASMVMMNAEAETPTAQDVISVQPRTSEESIASDFVSEPVVDVPIVDVPPVGKPTISEKTIETKPSIPTAGKTSQGIRVWIGRAPTPDTP
ncbi:MAG: efflux RND transporter permease subunit [Sphaerochaetaceae bacterium]|nr:efflux RND transporter permease subunit [Sphaerochaetaceae bacterium]